MDRICLAGCVLMLIGTPAQFPIEVAATDVSDNASGPSPTGTVPSSGSATTTTTVKGGVGPYTFLWTKLTDADGDDFAIVSNTAQNAAWSGLRDDAHADNTETWRVTATDAISATATADISITLIWNDTA